MSMVFDLVSQNSKLMEVLSEACYVDIVEVHARPRITDVPLVRSDFCKVICKADTQIDEVLIEKNLYFAEDGHEDIPVPDWLTVKLGLAVNAADWTEPLNLAWALDENLVMPESMAHFFPNRLNDEEIFSGVVNLPLRLRAALHRNNAETPVEIGFTLWEVLVALYGSFGQMPPFWNTDQPRITEFQENMDQLRRIFESDDDSELP